MLVACHFERSREIYHELRIMLNGFLRAGRNDSSKLHSPFKYKTPFKLFFQISALLKNPEHR